MTKKTAFIYHDALSRHVLRDDHVMVPSRIRYTYELLESYGAFQLPNSILIQPRNAERHEILSFHTETYVNGVEKLSRGYDLANQGEFNFSEMGDNPVYGGMFEASMLSTGASLLAAEMLIRGDADIAFNCSGGLHHAMTNHTSGFCIFNDPVIAINLLLKHGLRVAYIDIDAHHGDGVQQAFYGSNQVMTISIHESGSFLFPGTGFTHEIGVGSGLGYSVNLPLLPNTPDEVYALAASELISPIVEWFAPDILVTQLGMDPYFRDPITHLGLTIQGHAHLVKTFRELANSIPWLALGGGGYDISAVIRGWTIDYGIMLDMIWPDIIPSTYKGTHGFTNLYEQTKPTIDDATFRTTNQFAKDGIEELKDKVFRLHRI